MGSKSIGFGPLSQNNNFCLTAHLIQHSNIFMYFLLLLCTSKYTTSFH